MVRHEVTYYDNYEVKRFREYIDGVLIEEIHYDEQGRIHGKYCKWYNNENLAVLSNCMNGIVNGLCYTWYGNGHMESETNYVDGIRNGIVRRWNDNGQLEYELTCVNGKITSMLEKGIRKWI